MEQFTTMAMTAPQLQTFYRKQAGSEIVAGPKIQAVVGNIL